MCSLAEHTWSAQHVGEVDVVCNYNPKVMARPISRYMAVIILQLWESHLLRDDE